VASFAKRHHRLTALPVFEQDKAARNPNRRARRRVDDLRPELVRLLFDCAHITIRAQLAVEWATGARVSSVLYGVRLCDCYPGQGSRADHFPRHQRFYIAYLARRQN
jgi:hypothetical protein